MSNRIDKQLVYDYLRKIPKGKVVTYGQIAEYLGSAKLARTVGNILHSNPDGDFYPCYKVVNAAGKLSSHYAFGSLEGQKERLEAEGIIVRGDKVDLALFQWQPHPPRLSLRNFRPADADLLFAYRNDSRCNLYQRYEDTSKAYLEKFVQDYAGSTFLSRENEQHYAIMRSADGEMVGDFCVFYSESDNCFTLGITIAPQFQGLGYAYAFLCEVIAQLRQHYPSVDLVALIEKGNEKSLALFRKLRFVEECYAESIQSYVYVLYGQAGG